MKSGSKTLLPQRLPDERGNPHRKGESRDSRSQQHTLSCSNHLQSRGHRFWQADPQPHPSQAVRQPWAELWQRWPHDRRGTSLTTASPRWGPGAAAVTLSPGERCWGDAPSFAVLWKMQVDETEDGERQRRNKAAWAGAATPSPLLPACCSPAPGLAWLAAGGRS